MTFSICTIGYYSLIALGLSDELLHTQANQILVAWKAAGTPLAVPCLFRFRNHCCRAQGGLSAAHHP